MECGFKDTVCNIVIYDVGSFLEVSLSRLLYSNFSYHTWNDPCLVYTLVLVLQIVNNCTSQRSMIFESIPSKIHKKNAAHKIRHPDGWSNYAWRL